MAVSFTTKDLLQKEIIFNLDKKVEILPYANRKFEGEIRRQGDTVTVQTLGNAGWTVGGTAGAAIPGGNFTVTAENLVVNKVAQINKTYTDLDAVQYNRDLRGDIASRIAEGQAQLLDKHVASFVKDAGTNLNFNLATTLSSSTMQAALEDIGVKLAENNVRSDGGAFFMTPQLISYLRQGNWLNSIESGYDIRSRGSKGMYNGRMVIETNNVPFAYDLTLAAQPTAGNNFVFAWTDYDGVSQSVTFTYTAAASASAAGDIALGATLADTQANTINAINGTGTAGASTYVDVSAADRKALETSMVHAADFVTNVSYVYFNTDLTLSSTFTSGSNTTDNKSRVMFAMDNETVNHVNQLNKFDVREESNSFSFNILGEMVYGGKVFAENAKRLVAYRFAV